jgi:WD40 repeat protein
LHFWNAAARANQHPGQRVESALASEGIVALVASVKNPCLIVGTQQGLIRVSDAEGKTWAREIQTGGPVVRIATSPDGSRIASVGQDQKIQVWNSADGKLFHTLKGDYVLQQKVLASTKDATRQKTKVDRLLASVDELKKAAEKEVEAAKKVEQDRNKVAESVEAAKKQVDAATKAVTQSEQSLQAAQAAVADAMKKVEAANAEVEKKRKEREEAEKKQMAALSQLAASDSTLAAASDALQRAQAAVPQREGMVELEKKELASLEQQRDQWKTQQDSPLPAVKDLCLADQGQWLAAVHADQQLRLYDASGSSLGVLPCPIDADQLVSGSVDECLASSPVAAPVRWTVTAQWSLVRMLGSPNQEFLSDRVTALDFSPDGKSLAIGSGPPSRYGDIRIYSLTQRTWTHHFSQVHSDSVLGLKFSPDGRILASSSADKTVRLIDWVHGKVLKTLEGHTHHVLGVHWQDSGQTLATASADKSVKTWNVETGEQRETLGNFSKEVLAVAFVGQSNTLLASSADGQIRVYENASGNPKRTLAGATGSLDALALLPDKKRVVAGGQAGQVWVWDLDKGALITTK